MFRVVGTVAVAAVAAAVAFPAVAQPEVERYSCYGQDYGQE